MLSQWREREGGLGLCRFYWYVDGCGKGNVASYVTQLCPFLSCVDCYSAFSGPRSVAMPFSQVVVFVLGVVIGQWLLRFEESYHQYYKEGTD